MYNDLIAAASAKHGVRAELITSLIQHESSFNPNAVGDNGVARGLGQMHPAACQTVGANWDDMFDPAKAIDALTAYLAFCIKHMGDERTGVMAYNQGPTIIGKAKAYADTVYGLIRPSSPPAS